MPIEIRKPKLKFRYSPEIDIKCAQDYINSNDINDKIEYKNWFLPEDLRFILAGKFNKKEINKILKEYTRVFYYLNQEEIKTGMQGAIKQWNKVENKYYSLVAQIFNNHPWPRGDYQCFPTIFKIFFEWEVLKIFCFPYKNIDKTDATRVISHEMLHIMFYGYVKAKYRITKQTKIPGRDKKYLWQLAEVFNTVIETWPPYEKVFCHDDPVPYPGMEKMYIKMRKQWQQNQDIKQLLDQWLK